MNDLKELCTYLLNELSNYKGHSREELLLTYINERLTQSFENYQYDLQQSLDYLTRRKELNVLKKLNRLK